MRFGLCVLIGMFLLVCPLWAQEEVLVSDVNPELDMTEEIDSTSVPYDSLTFVLADSVQVVDSVVLSGNDDLILILPDNPVLYQGWYRRFPLQNPSTSALKSAAADSLYPSQLRILVESVPLDPSLSYAQSDLRLPVYMDGTIPENRQPSLSEEVNSRLSRQNVPEMEVDNPYRRQIAYADRRHRAVFRYSMNNMRSIRRFRPEHSDLPTERKMIDRQELSGDEQIEIGLGLELETATLNVEQVIFHADKWHRRGTTELQISQTSLSDNWHKGGDDNMTLYNYDKLAFSRYDESKKTTLDIALELRLSGYYTQADTIHPMRVNDNQFRVDVSYGYKAWKNWYYSSSAYIKTPIFEFYNANSNAVRSTFLSPLEANMAVGLDLKLTGRKNYSYSLMLAPLSYNLKYVNDQRVPVTSYGIDKDHRSQNQVGASITSRLEWKINNNVSWSSRAYFFTSYHNTVLEFENTFNVVLGRHSTAKVYLYPRFDDSVDDKIQMKEMLTFGLAFTW